MRCHQFDLHDVILRGQPICTLRNCYESPTGRLPTSHKLQRSASSAGTIAFGPPLLLRQTPSPDLEARAKSGFEMLLKAGLNE